jgi:glycosyltransferase involved in cell wall biosynthesis
MRIVHILTRLLRAGSEENTLLTSAGQMARGHEVILLHGHDVMPEHAARLAPGAELIAAPSLTRELNPARDVAAFHEIRQILAATRPDVVHTHQSKAGIIGRLAAARAHVPTIVHGVHILPFLGVGRVEKAAYLWSERRVAKLTHGFIHVSEGMRRAAIDHGVGPGRPHYVVPSGFDLSRFATAEPPPDLTARLSADAGGTRPFVIAMLAAFEPRKRHLDLLRQGAGFLRQFPQVRLVFAGEGHLRPEVESEIAALGLEGQVVLLGFRNDPARIIAAADACIHCSEREGLPRSVLQYLSAGRPVVLFDLPGIEEIITDGVNGFVLPQGDWAGFFARLAMLVTSPERRAEVAAQARATSLARWDAPFMAERTLAIYEELRSGGVPAEAAA